MRGSGRGSRGGRACLRIYPRGARPQPTCACCMRNGGCQPLGARRCEGGALLKPRFRLRLHACMLGYAPARCAGHGKKPQMPGHPMPAHLCRLLGRDDRHLRLRLRPRCVVDLQLLPVCAVRATPHPKALHHTSRKHVPPPPRLAGRHVACIHSPQAYTVCPERPQPPPTDAAAVCL